MAIVNYLNQNKYLKGNVVVSGSSAGGIATILWSNYIS